MVGGTFLATHGETSRRAGGVQVFGTDERLWALLEHGDVPVPREQDVVLNERLARHLGVHPGDSVSLLVPVPSTIPRESLLGKREGDFHEIPLTVRAILDENSGAGRLTLNPTQQLPLDAFVPLAVLQEGMGLAKIERSRRNPDRRSGPREHAVRCRPLGRRSNRPDGPGSRQRARHEIWPPS